MQMPKVGPASKTVRKENRFFGFSRIMAAATAFSLVAIAPLISRADDSRLAKAVAPKCESEFKVKRDDVLKALENAKGKEIDVTKGGVELTLEVMDKMNRETGWVPSRAMIRRAAEGKPVRMIAAGNFEMFVDPVDSGITVYRKGTKNHRVEDQVGAHEGAADFRPEDRDYFPKLKADLKYATVVLINADTLVMADGYKVYLYNSDGRGFMTSFNGVMALNSRPLLGFLTKEARIAAVIARDDTLRDITEIVSITINSQTLASSDPRKVCIEEGALAVLTPPASF